MYRDAKKKVPDKKDSGAKQPEEQDTNVSEEAQSEEEENVSALDEVLKDPDLKAEYDARIQEAVEAALAENQDGTEEETPGAEEADEPEDEALEDEIPTEEQRTQDLDAREKSLLARELKATAIEELAREQLPAALADCFNYESEEAFKLSKEKVVKAFQESIKEAVNARLRGKKPPKTSGEGAKSGNVRKNTFSEVINSQRSRR